MTDLPDADFVSSKGDCVLAKRVEVWIPREELGNRDTCQVSHYAVTGIASLPCICGALRRCTNSRSQIEILAVDVQVVVVQERVR